MRFDTVHLQWAESLHPLSSGNGGVGGLGHSLQGQHRYRGRHPCCQAQRSHLFQADTSPTPSVCSAGGSSLQGRQPKEDSQRLLYYYYKPI